MATTTTTGAKKIENSDQWGEIFDIHNDTVDAYDQLHEDTVEDYDDKIDDLSNAMGIVETGDVATHAIEAGQYVIWKRTLYTADAAITIGETLAATGGSKNLTAVEKGGLNALNASLIGFPNYADVVEQRHTIESGKQIFTAPKDCILYLSFGGSTRTYNEVYVNGNFIGLATYFHANGAYGFIPLFLKQGDVVTVANSLSSSAFAEIVAYGLL